jgi:hypothetical protein
MKTYENHLTMGANDSKNEVFHGVTIKTMGISAIKPSRDSTT